MHKRSNLNPLAYAAAAVLLPLALGGCQPETVQNPAPVPVVVAPSPIDDSHPRARLIVGSPGLQGNIVLAEPRFRPVGNFQQAQVTVRNLTQDRYTLEYRIDWFDDQDFSVDDRRVWHRLTLNAYEERALTSTGKTAQASKVTVIVRLPDDRTMQF
jgi:uncharacterized protein YcfL